MKSRVMLQPLALIAALVGSARDTRRADADAGGAIAGALVGGIIGHAIAKDKQRKRSLSCDAAYPQVSSAQRQINREMQTALNYFGFGAGAVDGAVGPGTRAAVQRNIQAQMGYPASGWIQPHERDFLMSAYQLGHLGRRGDDGRADARRPADRLSAE